MKACVLHGAGELRVDEVPTPAPGEHEVLVRLAAGGICGSDLHYFVEGGAGDFRMRAPFILGHEGAGEVVAVGAEVTAVRVGDRVAVNPNHPCGACAPCREGRRQLCAQPRFFGSAARFPHTNGLFAEYFVAAAGNCLRVPPELPACAAACAEPLAVALHAVAQAGSLAGRTVFIVGSGPIGVLLVAAAQMAGAARIGVSDLWDEPLAVARRMGATETINARHEPEKLAAAAAERGSFEVVFEASGHPAGVATALQLARPGATVVQVGMLPPGATPVPFNLVVAKELRCCGTFRFDGEYAAAVAALAEGRVDVAPMLTQAFAFEEAAAAFATAADKRRAMKVSLCPTGGGWR